MKQYKKARESLLRYLSSRITRKELDDILREIRSAAGGTIPTEDTVRAYLHSPDKPTKLSTYQQIIAMDVLLEHAEVNFRTLCDLIRYQQMKAAGVVSSADEFLQLIHPNA